MMDDFQLAYERARRKIGETVWPLLTNEEQEAAVARELRAIEEEPPSRPATSGDASNG